MSAQHVSRETSSKPIPCEHWSPLRRGVGSCAIDRFDDPSFMTCAECLVRDGVVPHDWRPPGIVRITVAGQRVASMPQWLRDRREECAQRCDGDLGGGRLCTIKRKGLCALARPAFICPLSRFGHAPIG